MIGVTEIARTTFGGCTALRRVVIPGSVTAIENFAFSGCENLETVEYLGCADGWNFISIGTYNEALAPVWVVLGDHAEGDVIDHKCVSCGVEMFGVCADSADDDDHVCDYGCGAVLEEHTEVIESAGFAPTCTENGLSESKHCSVCGEILSVQEVILALGHSESETVMENEVDVTCTTGGRCDFVVYCTTCGVELSRETVTVDAAGHSAGETVVENYVAPDCVNAGGYDNVKYCTVCGAECDRETVTLSALGHSAGETVVENNVDPDCVNTGSYDNVTYCTVCGAECSRKTVVVKALGHTAGETTIENRVEPDCINRGSYDNVTYCAVCGKDVMRYKTWINPLGHTSVEDAAVSPTCTETGLTAGRHCSVCEKILVEQTVVPATGHTYTTSKYDEEHHKRTCDCGAEKYEEHTWVNGKIIASATHTAYGSKQYTCKVCRDTKTEQIDKLPDHSYGAWEAHDGLQHKRSCKCGESEYADHTWNNGVITTPATHTAFGEMTYTCGICGKNKSEYLAFSISFLLIASAIILSRITPRTNIGSIESAIINPIIKNSRQRSLIQSKNRSILLCGNCRSVKSLSACLFILNFAIFSPIL